MLIKLWKFIRNLNLFSYDTHLLCYVDCDDACALCMLACLWVVVSYRR
jgi:hypothetical protein